MTKVTILGEQNAVPEKKYKLPKYFAEKWVNGLRSGKYKQDKQFNAQLRNKNRYCAIGVCAIENEFEFENDLTASKNGLNIYDAVGTKSESYLSYKISTLNDFNRLSFSEIADWIEQNVEFI